MNKEYLLILPDVFVATPTIIGEITFQRYGSEDDLLVDNNMDLLLNVQQMLINNGYSGIFTYSFFQTNVNFHEIVLKMRKIMTIFRYVAIEKHLGLSLGTLAYYLLEPIEMKLDIPEMKYSLSGIQDGISDVHFWAPGFREVISEISSLQTISLDNEHFLIQKFNAGELEDKYIIAIERFNRTLKNDYDPVEDILNLTTAFEHIIELPRHDKAKSLANRLISELGLKDTPLEKYFIDWSKQFYQVRNDISHGNVLKRYTEKAGYNYWEECFKWKHPHGKTRYKYHSSIAKDIFKALIQKRLNRDKTMRDNTEDVSVKDKEFLKQLEYKLLELELGHLITPNEIHYKQIKELADKRTPFGEPYFELISKIRRPDGSEEKSILIDLLNYFLSSTKNRFPDLEKEYNELKKLVVEKKDTALIQLKVFKLSQKIHKKDSCNKVNDEERFHDFYLSQFFEKVYHSLNRFAWQEHGKN